MKYTSKCSALLIDAKSTEQESFEVGAWALDQRRSVQPSRVNPLS